MAIYAYAETAADPRWRTSVVPWDGTQIVADVGCGNGFDLRQIVPQGRWRHAIGLDLSAGMLRSLEDYADVSVMPTSGRSACSAVVSGLKMSA
jgi:SAM-dependent methyltransferase